MAGNTITVGCPSGIFLDTDNYLFIVDYGNHRIIGEGPNGFQCLIRCYGTGCASNQLYYPHSLSFDSYGNIFVVDTGNNPIQIYFLLTKR